MARPFFNIKFIYILILSAVLLAGFNNCGPSSESSIMKSSSCAIEGNHNKVYLNFSSNPVGAPRWPNGIIKWYYNPNGQPTKYSSSTVLAIINDAINKWQKVCNIKWSYQGTTTRSQQTHGDNFAVMGWGNANGYYAYTVTRWFQPGKIVDGDIELSPYYLTDLNNFLGTINHELGHQLGLEHSDIQDSIMYANPYNSVLFEQTLRQDDIDGCVGLYGAPTTTSPPGTPPDTPPNNPPNTPPNVPPNPPTDPVPGVPSEPCSSH